MGVLVAVDDSPRTEIAGESRERRATYRLRDLSRRDRWLAAVGAAIVVLPPVVAFLHFLPDWRPGGDNAFIGFRVLDVGTSRTPLLGQPSSSGHYGGDDINVRHLGAFHFYLMAPFVRLLGTAAGMLLTSVLVTSAGALLTVWVVFRQMGRSAGVMAVVAMAAVMFGIGAAGLIDPISSNFALVPLFSAAILVWAVLVGDLRLLPLAVVALSLAVQQHLSVGPSVAVLALAALISWSVRWWRARRRQDREGRREAGRWGLIALALGLLVWLPLLAQQIAGRGPGNLSALWSYATDTETDQGKLGMAHSLRQVGHVLDYPWLVIRTQLSGHDLQRPLGLGDWLFVAALVGLLGWAARRWARAGQRRVSLVAMVGVLVVAGLLNGATIPRGWEQGRLAFYHWIWPLSFVLILAVMFLPGDGVRWLASQARWRRLVVRVRGRLPAGLMSGRLAADRRVAGVAGGVLAVALLGLPIANTQLDRPTNELSEASLTYPRHVYEDLTDQVLEHRDEIPPGDILLVVRGESFFEGSYQAIGLAFEEAGLPLRFPNRFATFMHDSRLAWDRDDFDSVLQVIINRTDTVVQERPGERIASYNLWEGVDMDAYRSLLDQLEAAEELVPGPELEELLEDPGVQALFEQSMDQESWGRTLSNPTAVQFMLDYPLAEPELDREALVRLRDSLREAQESGTGTVGDAVNMEVYLVTDPEEMREATVWMELREGSG